MLLFYQRVLALLTTYLIVKYEFQGNATRSRLREIFNMGMLHTAAIYKVINYEQLLFKALIKIIVCYLGIIVFILKCLHGDIDRYYICCTDVDIYTIRS